MSRFLPVLLLVATVVFAAGELDRGQQQFQKAQYRQVIETVKPLSAAGDSAALTLTGKAWFMLADYKKSSDAFERAVAAGPTSENYHWLGKAYGRRAETSSPLSAPFLASRARTCFERAVELDGKNSEAINDLFSYYMEAPGFLGGGLDKAQALAERMKALDPVEYHYDLAQVAEKRKEFKTAEFHFRSAFEMAPRSVGRAIDLARFLSKQGRDQESEIIFAQAEQIAPNTPRLLFEHASAYVRAKKNLDTAKELLQKYLHAPLTPDDPPRAEAERLLRQAGA